LAGDPSICSTCNETLINVLAIWRPKIKGLAQSLAKKFRLDDSMADDLVQEACLRVLLATRNGRPLTPPYLKRVIINAMRSAIRRERVKREHECSLSALEHWAHAQQANSDPLLATWLLSLPPRLYEIYDLLYVAGCTQEEAGKRLGLSQARVSQLNSCLLTLVRSMVDPIP
jgi:RNA polymerase sigma factor (sigma-70 family)